MRTVTIMAAALCLASCTGYQDGRMASLSAGFEGTRVQMSGISAVWNAGDRLSVFYGSEENLQWEYRGEDCAASGIVSGRVPLSSGTGEVYAVYPYDSGSSLSGRVLSASIPCRQSAQAGSFDREAVLMVGHTSSSSVTLRFANSFLSLNPGGCDAPFDSITVRSAGGESLSGPCVVDLSSESPEAYTVGPDSVVLLPGGQQTGAGTYFVPIAPGTYEEGFLITVHYPDGRTSVTRDELPCTLQPGHVHGIDVVAGGVEDVLRMTVPFVRDGCGYSPFVGVTAERGKAKVLTGRSFTLSDFPSCTLGFRADRLRLVWGANNGLELMTSADGWIETPAVTGRTLLSVGVATAGGDVGDVVTVVDTGGAAVPFVRKSSLPGNLFHATLHSPAPGASYRITFNTEDTFLLTELVFNYGR